MNALAIRTAAVSLPREMLLALRYASKTITDFVLGGLALPSDLEPLGALIMAFVSGTAASTALHHFIHRNREHRARIDLAVFLVARVVEMSPQYRGLLDRPDNLLHMLDDQVMPVLHAHLNDSETKIAMAQLKRKVGEDVEEFHAVSSKRCRVSEPDRIMAGGNTVVTAPLQQMAPPSLEPTPSSVRDSEGVLAVSEVDVQTQLSAECCEEDDSVQESVEDELRGQQTSSDQHTMDSFTSQEPLLEYETSSSSSKTHETSSTIAQPRYTRYLATPFSGLVKRSVSSRNPGLGHKRRVPSPTPAPRRTSVDIHPSHSSSYELDHNYTNLDPTPKSSNRTSASLARSSAGRLRSRSDVRPSATIDESVRDVENITAYTQQRLESFPVREVQGDQAQLSNNAFSQATTEDPSTTTPASKATNVRSYRKRFGRTKKDATQASMLPTPLRGLAATGDQVSHLTVAELSTPTFVQASLQAPKRKVGRPRKNDTHASAPTTPVNGATASIHESVIVVANSKRRGRPPKTPIVAAPVEGHNALGTDARQQQPLYIWLDESQSLGLRT